MSDRLGYVINDNMENDTYKKTFRVCLLDIKTPQKANLDCMGGFGVGSAFGRSWFTKLIARGKRDGVRLPLMDYGYLAGAHGRQGDRVVVGGVDTEADIYYLHHSLVGYNAECDAIKDIPQSKIRFIGPLSDSQPVVPMGFPDWSVFDFRNFSYYPSLKVKPVIPALASTGCKFSCSYCPYSAVQGMWRARPIQEVFDELFVAKYNYGAKGIVFRDPLFTGDIKRTKELCVAIEPLGLQWACETRLECLDKETICAMARAGAKSIHVGIESASKLSLSGVGRKNLSVQVMRDLIRYIQGQGVKVLAFYILGLPEDTYGSCEETIKLSIYLDTNFAEYFVATPYPNTPFFEKVKENILTTDYTKYNGFTLVWKHPSLSSLDLVELREKAYHAFYLRPRFAWRFLKHGR